MIKKNESIHAKDYDKIKEHKKNTQNIEPISVMDADERLALQI